MKLQICHKRTDEYFTWGWGWRRFGGSAILFLTHAGPAESAELNATGETWFVGLWGFKRPRTGEGEDKDSADAADAAEMAEFDLLEEAEDDVKGDVTFSAFLVVHVSFKWNCAWRN